jgi:anti-sigma B factor antagonist
MQLNLEGELTIAQIAAHQAALLAQLSQADGEPTRLDMASITDLDSAGVQLLLALRRHLAQLDMPLHLHNASAAVRQALDTYHLDAMTLEPRAQALHIVGEDTDD